MLRAVLALVCLWVVAIESLAAPLPGPIILRRIDANGLPLPTEVVRRLGTPPADSEWSSALVYAPDGKALVSCGSDVRLTDLATGKVRWSQPDRWPWSPQLALAEDGRSVWVAGRRYDPATRDWAYEAARYSLADGRVLRRSVFGEFRGMYFTMGITASGRGGTSPAAC
jgi:hypothetical protein